MTNRLFFLDQHGCAKNQVDGELLISHLNNLGFSRTDNAEEAELIVINSCGFIESAKAESIESIISAKENYPNSKILLAGCLAERYNSSLLEQMDEIDGILGNGDISLVEKAVTEMDKGLRPVVLAPQKGVCCGERKELLGFDGSSYVKITEGCNNRCSFCAIPLIRGELRSRKIDEIVAEIKELLQRGVVEINLIGQDLASYGKDLAFSQSESPLCLLLKEIHKITGDFWIRLLYIHPDNFPFDILDEIKSDSRILPYFDIPFQSGDNSIISAMNRRGTDEIYLNLVSKIREKLPNAVLRTTFLTGFPGESDENFNNTLNFLKKVSPDWSGCFAYSREDDTPAYLLKKSVPKKTASKRKVILENMQLLITEERLNSHIDKIYDVIIEEVVPAKDGEETCFAIGRAWFQAPDVDGATVVSFDLTDEKQKKSVKCGAFVKCRVTGINGVDIEGFML